MHIMIVLSYFKTCKVVDAGSIDIKCLLGFLQGVVVGGDGVVGMVEIVGQQQPHKRGTVAEA